jgi:lipopolysaccharide/colanic/teichoic acid biosynthesis glycosyltransferase
MRIRSELPRVPVRPIGRPVVVDSRLRRCVDVVAAVCGLALAWPLLVGLGVAIRLTSPGPAIFRQIRVGRAGRSFEIWKFRTMVAGADRAGPMVSGRADPRITPLGQWLRGNRLDELPQLVNLLRGDLTLVGPRPEVPRFIGSYTAAERDLLRVRPGIIGPGALLFATTQSGELDQAADPDAYYVLHHLHPKLTLDLEYLTDRRLSRDVALVARAVGVSARTGGTSGTA